MHLSNCTSLNVLQSYIMYFIVLNATELLNNTITITILLGIIINLNGYCVSDFSDENAAAAVERNAAAAAAGGVGGLQQSVTALLDAMRDLLSNVNTRGEGDAGDVDDSEADGDNEH